MVFQFDITSQIGSPSIHLNEKADNKASFRLEISNLDNFENVSLVLNNDEIEIVNVVLTDYDMEVGSISRSSCLRKLFRCSSINLYYSQVVTP